MIRVFPRRTKWTPVDELAFVGEPPLPGLRPPDMPVRVSVTFTWDYAEGQRLLDSWRQYYTDVQIGGPALCDMGGEFVPGRFLKEGVTITSRGCPFNCQWCLVPKREGDIRELPIRAGHIVQDNNLLACSEKHIRAVFDMLGKQQQSITFAGGLDSKLLKPWHIELLRSIRLHEMWFASDTEKAMRRLGRIANMLSVFPQNKKRCYVLIGYEGESIETAARRLEAVYAMGFLPFAQLYQPADKPAPVRSQAWHDLKRKWMRPAAYRARKDIHHGKG
jgi:hypothetical protein